MRNIDLDQFWPMLPQRPGRQLAEAERAQTSEPPPLPHDDLGIVLSPPPLAYEAAGPDETEDAAPDAQDATLDAIAAAAEGWAPEDAPPPLPGLLSSVHEAEPEVPAGADGLSSVSVPATRSKRRDFTPVIWGGIGFFAGIFAWHAIGFWTFLSDVVLNDKQQGGLTNLAANAPRLPATTASTGSGDTKVSGTRSPRAAAILKPAADARFACVTLALDRDAGATKAGACADSANGLRDAGFNRRSDRLALRPRLQDPVAWTGSTAVEVSTADATGTPQAGDSAATFGTLTDADLKLDLD